MTDPQMFEPPFAEVPLDRDEQEQADQPEGNGEVWWVDDAEGDDR